MMSDSISRLSVLQVLPKYSPRHWAGAEAAVAALHPELDYLGCDTRVITLSLPGDAASEHLGDLDVRRFPPSRFLRPSVERQLKGSGAVSGRAFTSLLRSTDDMLHLHALNRFTTSAANAALLTRRPYVVSIHSRYVRDDRAFFRRTPLAADWTLQHSARVLCVSERDACHVRDFVGHERVTVMPNGVSPRFERGQGEILRAQLAIPQDDLVVLQVGRVCALKNQGFTVDVLPHLERTLGQRCRLLIAGDVSEPGYHAALMQRIADDPWLADRVRYLGALDPVHELPNAYAASDVVLLPSTHEAQPLVLNEAWAAKRPVAVLKDSGLDDAVNATRLGVAMSTDQVAAAQELSQLITQQQSDALSTRWANYQPRYWSEVAQELKVVYEAVMAD